MPDNTAKIAELEEVLNSGAKRTRIDNTDVEIDLGEIRRRIEELKAEDTTDTYTVKPKISGIKIGNAW